MIVRFFVAVGLAMTASAHLRQTGSGKMTPQEEDKLIKNLMDDQKALPRRSLVLRRGRQQLEGKRPRHGALASAAAAGDETSSVAASPATVVAPSPAAAQQGGVPTIPQYEKITVHNTWWFVRQVIGGATIACGVLMWLLGLPCMLRSEREQFEKEKIEGRTFEQYLSYRFNYWMSSGGTSALMTLLGLGTLTLLTIGALLYWILQGGSPVTGLWLCFVWASAASVDPAEPAVLGVIGMLVTMGGLVLLAVLLTAIADFFASTLATMASGRGPVVEGGHIVILGHSSRNKELIEEIAKCEEDGAPRTVVILDTRPKAQIEDEIEKANTDVGDLKLIVRTGEVCSAQDLFKAGADIAARVVIPEDPSLSCDESDAVTFGTLLTLKGQGKQGWPINGYVAAQSCMNKNVNFMRDLHEGKTYVLSGERLGRLIVQGALDQGLCNIWNQIIGFDGDEFYTGDAQTLGVVGKTFRDLPFWFQETIPIGVRHGDGEYQINPYKGYVLKEDDTVILLADDDDSVHPVETEPHMDFDSWFRARPSAKFVEADCADNEPIKVLIFNFAERGPGCAILFALDEMTAAGTTVEIYTTLSQEEAQNILADSQKKAETYFQNITVTAIHSTPSASMTAMSRLKSLPLETFDETFLLSDAAQDAVKQDKQTVATVIQMSSILKDRGVHDFQPMVEVCTTTCQDQLNLLGIENMINTSHMMTRALAMVAMSKVAHGVLSDLLSTDGNSLDIMYIKDYMAEGEEVPTQLSFAEITAIVNRASQMIAIGWSEHNDGTKSWVVNPKDKVTQREWTPDDKVIVIKDL